MDHGQLPRIWEASDGGRWVLAGQLHGRYQGGSQASKRGEGKLPAAKRAILVVNRRSGTADQELEQALDRLRADGVQTALFQPDDPAEIGDIIRKEAETASMVVLGGGDGTLSGAAGALLEAGLPLGVLPMGTANDFARGLQIPADLDQAAEVILKGHIRAVDVGLVDERPFFNVACIGFGADVARFHRGERKQLLKLMSYPLSWIDAYRNHRPFRAEIVCDGVARRSRCSQLAVGSGRHYGGGLTIATEARVDDGWLRVYYLRPLGFWGWLRLIPSLRFGTVGRDERAELLSAKTIDISTRPSKVINVDGELAGQTPARFRILPQALSVFVPEEDDTSFANQKPDREGVN